VLFGIVAAGEVHPQPQILLFGNAPKAIYVLVGLTSTVVVPHVHINFTASCAEKTHEQWSHSFLQ
jgi:hypothetical protein